MPQTRSNSPPPARSNRRVRADPNCESSERSPAAAIPGGPVRFPHRQTPPPAIPPLATFAPTPSPPARPWQPTSGQSHRLTTTGSGRPATSRRAQSPAPGLSAQSQTPSRTSGAAAADHQGARAATPPHAARRAAPSSPRRSQAYRLARPPRATPRFSPPPPRDPRRPVRQPPSAAQHPPEVYPASPPPRPGHRQVPIWPGRAPQSRSPPTARRSPAGRSQIRPPTADRPRPVASRRVPAPAGVVTTPEFLQVSVKPRRNRFAGPAGGWPRRRVRRSKPPAVVAPAVVARWASPAFAAPSPQNQGRV